MSTTFMEGDIVEMRTGEVWQVRDVYQSTAAQERGEDLWTVSLVNPRDENHGTAFFSHVLADVMVRHERPRVRLLELMKDDLGTVLPSDSQGRWVAHVAALLVDKGWNR